MKTNVMIFIIVIVLFSGSPLNAQIVDLQWNTFLGGISDDTGNDIVFHSSGNIYVTGSSNLSWGSPINAFSGITDAFVACLDSSGNLLWNTFLGSSSEDHGYSIALDSSGKIYVTGESGSTWGSPVYPHLGGEDAFAACLDSSGNLLWNTFRGTSNNEFSHGITPDSSGHIYWTGYSEGSWGSPINAYSGSGDAFVICLDNSGNRVWNTFLGSSDIDAGMEIVLDNLGKIYLTGQSYATWGSPVNAHSGGGDAYIACLDSSGNLLWNTFLGSGDTDYSVGIVLHNSGSIYVTGYCYATWGSPINAHSGNMDGFVACLGNTGNLLWNTFLGSFGYDYSHDITLDSSGNVYVTGSSDATWGSPINPHSGLADAFVACLDSSGYLDWNTFLGSTLFDFGYGITLDSSGNIYTTGLSTATWGSPINAHSGGNDAFVAILSTDPIPNIKANGLDGPISITESDSLQIRVSLATYGSTDNADFWLAYKGPAGWYHYNKKTKSWESGLDVTHQGALFDLNNKKVFQSSGLSPGTYRFYFGVDMVMDGNLTKSCLYYDMVKVTVTSD